MINCYILLQTALYLLLQKKTAGEFEIFLATLVNGHEWTINRSTIAVVSQERSLNLVPMDSSGLSSFQEEVSP